MKTMTAAMLFGEKRKNVKKKARYESSDRTLIESPSTHEQDPPYPEMPTP